MEPEMYRKYRAEVERLESEIAHYDLQWTTVPHFAWVALFAPLVGYLWGWGFAFVNVFTACALVGVRAYLIAMRKSEVVWTRDRLLVDMGDDPAQPGHQVKRSGVSSLA